MTMHVNLSAEMEGFIKSKVAGGFYGSATEVIRDAIRRMQAEESRVQAWHAAIKQGADQLDRGEGVATDTVQSSDPVPLNPSPSTEDALDSHARSASAAEDGG